MKNGVPPPTRTGWVTIAYSPIARSLTHFPHRRRVRFSRKAALGLSYRFSSKAAVAGRAPIAFSLDSTEKGVVHREDGALLAHGTSWMSPCQGDGCFEYGALDRA